MPDVIDFEPDQTVSGLTSPSAVNAPAIHFEPDVAPRTVASPIDFTPDEPRTRPVPGFSVTDNAQSGGAAPSVKPDMLSRTVDDVNNSSNNPFDWMRTSGKLAKSFLTDVFAGHVQPTPTRLAPDFPNTAEFWQGKEPSDFKSLPTVAKGVAETGAALPTIGVGTLATLATGGEAAPMVWAGLMGGQAFNDRSDLPMAQRVTEAVKQGTIGALMPGASEVAAKIGADSLTKLALKTGASDGTVAAAQALGKVAGSQSLLDGLMVAGQAPELVEQSQSDPEGFKESLVKIVAGNLAFEVPHLPAIARDALAKEQVTSYMGSPEYRANVDDVATHLLSPRSAQWFAENRPDTASAKVVPSGVPFTAPTPGVDFVPDSGTASAEPIEQKVTEGTKGQENGGNAPGTPAGAGEQITTSELPAAEASATQSAKPVKGATMAELVGAKLDEIKALLTGSKVEGAKVEGQTNAGGAPAGTGEAPVLPEKTRTITDDFTDELRRNAAAPELEQKVTEPTKADDSSPLAAQTTEAEPSEGGLKPEDVAEPSPAQEVGLSREGRQVREGDESAKPKVDAIEDALNRAIEATKFDPTKLQEGITGAPVWITKAAANGALRVVKAVYLATKNMGHALQAGLTHLRESELKGYNEDEARAWISSFAREVDGTQKPEDGIQQKVTKETNVGENTDGPAQTSTDTGAKPEWQTLREKVDAASDKLKQAIHEHGTPGKFGKTKTQTLAAKNLSGAEYRNARAELNEHAGYANHLFDLHDKLVKELRGMSAEDPRRSQLTFDIENVQDEISKLDKRVANGAFNARNPEQLSRSEQAAKENLEHITPEERRQAEAPTPDVDETAELPENRTKRLIAELPGRAREVFQTAKQMQDKFRNTWKTRNNRDAIAAGKDAADTIANRIGAQAGNLVRHELNRAFGESDINARNDVREWALTAVIESGMDRETLAEHRRGVESSENSKSVAARQWLTAAKYAERHWDRLTKVAQIYKKITDTEVAVENEAGIPTLHRDGGYVFHLQDVTPNWAGLDLSAGGTGAAAPFKHIRDHATYAEAIASGVKPQTLNAVDLLQHRVGLGRKLIGYRAWIESMGHLVDPTSDKPVMTEPIVRKRADGTSDTTAPSGYKLESFAGQTVAVHNGYEGLFKALTGESGLSGTGWQAALKTAQTIKHVMLVADTFHAGRLAYFNMFVRGAGEGAKAWLPGNPFAYKRGVTLLDNTAADIRAMAERGDIPKEWVNDLTGDRALLDRALKQGLNVGHAVDNMYNDWVKHLPIAGDFNKWLFGKMQRGAMSEASIIEMKRQANKLGRELNEGEVRQIAKDLNTRFGNLGSQGWIKSRTAQDLARLFLLAPSWNESLLRAEGGSVKAIAGAARDLATPGKKVNMGLLGRSAMTAVALQFVANQVLNMVTRGHPTWQNPETEEGAKLSAWIPDVVGHSAGYFLNPLTLPTEISHYMIKSLGRTGDVTKTLKEFLGSRLQPVSRAGLTLITREDETGSKLRTGGEVLRQMLASAVPLPLSAGAIKRAVTEPFSSDPQQKYPGEYQKQLAQTFGLKLDMAPSPEQRIRNLATQFNRDKGVVPNADFYHGSYYFIDRATLVGNKAELAKEVGKLLETKTPADVLKHYDRWVSAPFTGSVAREAEFRATLNPEQKDAYVAARQKRQALATMIKQAVVQGRSFGQ